MLNYEPKPIDTSGVTLTEELLELKEPLAKNVHDVWAQQRLSEGKKHPSLVPYDQLPESEKEYDRNTAMGTLKAVLAMGYRIEPPAPAPSTLADRELATVLQLLEDPSVTPDLDSLLALWRARNPDHWSRTPRVYRQLGDRILALGEPLLAYDVLEEGLEHWSEDVRLRQLKGLALARSGATQEANAMLKQLRHEEHGSQEELEETLGTLARTYKDFWAMATEPAEREKHLRRAAEVYEEAYQRTGGYWTGINAATMALLLGQRERAAALAREVRERCLQELNQMEKEGSGDRYWPLATLGEAALILEECSEAEERYCQAAEVGRGQFGNLSSTRRQARFLLEHVNCDRERIERCFRIPRVVVFAGHMIDQPGRAAPRFPPQLEHAVRDAIRDRLEELDARLGYASAACGSDILFLEAILELDGKAHVVLPYDEKQFMEDSVEVIPGVGWGVRCEQVLQRATEILTASEQRMEWGSVLYDYVNLLLHGLASIRAGQLETELVPLAVWDGRQGDGPGGTASMVKRWRDLGHDVELIDMAEILRQEYPEAPSVIPPPPPPPEPSLEMMAVLFGDVVKFSRLTEEEIPRFVQHCLGAIAELIDTSRHKPVIKNTWGDGLYLVFPSVRDAGQFALELCDLMGNTDWAANGLPKDLRLRIALHAGPAYSCIDPVTQQPNYVGTHVTRAARMEPITPAGQVYASLAFAALAAAERVGDFTCDYVGQMVLAKGYGTFPIYHVRRRNL